MKTKEEFKKEVLRIEELLNKKFYVQMRIQWYENQEEKRIFVKNISVLRDKGNLEIVGIVYFTCFHEGEVFIGQLMLFLDEGQHEISCTIYFSENRYFELSSSWTTGIHLLGLEINDKLSEKKPEPVPVPAYMNSNTENLKDGFYCYLCDMPYYNCLCSHDDED